MIYDLMTEPFNPDWNSQLLITLNLTSGFLFFLLYFNEIIGGCKLENLFLSRFYFKCTDNSEGMLMFYTKKNWFQKLSNFKTLTLFFTLKILKKRRYPFISQNTSKYRLYKNSKLFVANSSENSKHLYPWVNCFLKNNFNKVLIQKWEIKTIRKKILESETKSGN